MNAQGMIKRLHGKLYTITRAEGGQGSYDPTNGDYVPGTIETIEVLGSVQPLNYQEIVSIPEGDRTRERYRFYSYPALKNTDVPRLTIGDLVTVNGDAFQVESVAHWPNHGKAIIVRVNTNAN